jgi:hypothetical protein
VIEIAAAAAWKSFLNLEEENYQLYGLDLAPLRSMMLNSPHVRQLSAQALLGEPLTFRTIGLHQPQSFLFDETFAFQITRSGTMYGVGRVV